MQAFPMPSTAPTGENQCECSNARNAWTLGRLQAQDTLEGGGSCEKTTAVAKEEKRRGGVLGDSTAASHLIFKQRRQLVRFEICERCMSAEGPQSGELLATAANAC
jgi:hypothetical protein